MGLRIIGRKLSGGAVYVDCLRSLTSNGCFKAIDVRENDEIEQIVRSLGERLARGRCEIGDKDAAQKLAGQLDELIRDDSFAMAKAQLPVEVATLLDLL